MAKRTTRSQHSKRSTAKRKASALLISIALLLLGIIFLVAALIVVLNNGAGDGATTGTTAATTTTTTTNTTVATTTTTTAATTTTPKTTSTTADVGNHYVQPANAAWNLKLANDWNTLPENYEATFTAVEYGDGFTGKKFDSRAVQALRDMIHAANKENPKLNIQPVSCFRPASYQKTLYWNEVAKWKRQGYEQAAAEKKAATVVKRPGQSEHNTGLAADLGGSGNYRLDQNFENTDAFKWLYEHCAEYGFILRFPKGKEDVTGVIYEPWHYRYVGKEIAQQIMSEGICLEEYLEKTAQ